MEALLKRLEEHFRRKEWKELEEASSELLASNPEGKLKALAEGFRSYARARQESEPAKIIPELERAVSAFKGVDELLYSMATTERLLLLSVFDEANRGQHLKALGEFSLNRFMRTQSEGDIRLAIEALERAREHLTGRELAEAELNLTFCYGCCAAVSDNPKREYERVISLCEELEERYQEDKATLARLRMNHATALQSLAQVSGSEAVVLLEKAATLSREAADIFSELGAKVEEVRALQSLANIYRDAATLAEEGEGYLERFIKVKKEIAKLFSEAEYTAKAAIEELEAGVARLELAAKRGVRAEIETALKEIAKVSEVFREEGLKEELAHSLAAMGAAYRSLASFSDDATELLGRAVESYGEAIGIFSRSGKQAYLGAAKAALAQVYRDLAALSSDAAHKEKAEKLEREAREILEQSSKNE
jgi:tetratricopeptide (TPR) repeat protein